jgi:hypothetical protein
MIQDQEKTLALLSAPPETPDKDRVILDDQLDHEFQHAATSVSTLFALKPLETVWLREVVVDGRVHVRRVIMDEKNGELINPRSGTLTPWETAVSKNVDRYFVRRKKNKNGSWLVVLNALLVLGLFLEGIMLYQSKQEVQWSRAELSKRKKQLEEVSQKVLMIDLIEKERQYATGPQSSLKRIYRQSTNTLSLPVPIYKKTETSLQVREEERSWVEGWNERIFPKVEKKDDEKK